MILHDTEPPPSAVEPESRLSALQRVTTELASALDADRIAEVIVDHGVRALGAQNAALFLADGDHARLVRSLGYSTEAHERVALLRLDGTTAISTAMRTRAPLVFASYAEYGERFPEAEAQYRREEVPIGAIACMPLVHRGNLIGGLSIQFGEVRTFGPEDEVYFELLAAHAVQALERARLFTELEAARAAAEEASRTREDLLAAVAHDLRNPLGVIQLKAQVMLRREDTEVDKVRKDAEVIARSSEQMTRLISDLLDVSAIDAGRVSVERERCVVAELLADVAEQARSQANPRDIRIVVVDGAEDESGPATVHVDRQRVNQIFGNVLGNAIKFAPAASTITIYATIEGPMVAFAIADEGPGIPPPDRERVFERWVKSDKSMRSGIGLGLYITRGLVEAHGGSIAIDPDVTRGTRVAFTLPRVP